MWKEQSHSIYWKTTHLFSVHAGIESSLKRLDSGFTDNICGVYKFPILMAFHALRNYFYSKISLCKLESDKGPGIH